MIMFRTNNASEKILCVSRHLHHQIAQENTKKKKKIPQTLILQGLGFIILGFIIYIIN